MINASLTRTQSVDVDCLKLEHPSISTQINNAHFARTARNGAIRKPGNMKQTQSVKLHNYWKELYGQSGVPERSQIEPMAIRDILGDTFILEFNTSGDINYRLAGTRLCAIFGSELKGQEFSSPWRNDGQETIADIVKSAARDNSIAIFGSTAVSKSGRKISIETLVLPLLHNGQKERRMLGVTSPISRPYWLGMDPIVSLNLSSLRIVEPKLENKLINSRFSVLKNSNPVPVSSIGASRKIKHLTVLEGGLSKTDEPLQI